MSLVSILTGLAIGAVLMTVLAVLFTSMTEMRVRGEIMHDADSLVNWLQDSLNNPIVCARALKQWPGPAMGIPPGIGSAGGPAVAWDVLGGAPPAVGHIEFNNGFSSVMGAYVNQILLPGPSAAAPRLAIRSMSLREPDPARGEGAPSRSRMQRQLAGGGTEDDIVVSSRLMINFQSSSSVIPTDFQRILDLTLGFQANAPYSLVFCYQNTSTINPPDTYCDQTKLGANPPCPIPNPGCAQWYYINAFDAAGVPQCACAIICATPPIGPPGGYHGGSKGGN